MSINDELTDIPEFIRDKLIAMRDNIDHVEALFSQIDPHSAKDLQSQNRVKSYMVRINEIAEKLENPDADKNKLKLDKQSSARIIKRSLWANANQKKGRSQVSDMVNATLESSVNGKRDLEDDESSHSDKKLKS